MMYTCPECGTGYSWKDGYDRHDCESHRAAYVLAELREACEEIEEKLSG